MKSGVDSRVTKAIQAVPATLQASAGRCFERLYELHGELELPGELIEPLVRIVACSEFAATTVIREWHWLVSQCHTLAIAPDMAALKLRMQELAAGSLTTDEVKQSLRICRNRFLLHILWREIAGLANLDETLRSLSELADTMVGAAAAHAQHQLQERFGFVRDQNGNPESVVILGMGKLGGNELNFSSDIDLIFLYHRNGNSDGQRSLSAEEYFTRVARHIISLLDERTADGFVFRIDTRLRPFGDSGPQVVSFAALESYLLRHGRDWERYAYVKARIVGPVPPPAVREDLYSNLISPFVYRRYLDFGVFESLREMQALIAAEVKRREFADNIKLGPGGIREIEFVVQSLQLVRGGSDPQVQGRELQVVMPKLVGRRGLRQKAVSELLDAYRFLRRLENFIQAIRDQQTHDVPADEIDRARLCLAMEYANWGALLADLSLHRENVTRLFDEIAFRGREKDSDRGIRDDLVNLWNSKPSVEQWAAFLKQEKFAEVTDLAQKLAAFRNAPTTLKIGSAAQQRLRTFISAFLPLVRDSSDPARALERTLAIIEKILRRSAYIALLNENPHALSRLVSLCERSAYVAEQIARYPVLLDELLDPGTRSPQPSRGELESDLQHRLAPAKDADNETKLELLGQFQRATMFRIVVADLDGNLPIMKVSDALTELAEVVLEYALQLAWSDMTYRYGVPKYVLQGGHHAAGFGIIAYGKLGGIELSYRSDLDLVFLHDSCGTEQMTDGDKPLENTVFFARLIRRLVLFLRTQTGSGVLYEVDTRLRPDGNSGLLVTNTDAFERYQVETAWTWEHQALLRARPVAGSSTIAEEFDRIRTETLTRRVRRDSLRKDVVSMRQRMRKELDRSGKNKFDLKQGEGGIGDIEFIVQYLVLKYAGQNPTVIHYSDNIRQLDALAAAGCVAENDVAELQEIYRQYRKRLHRMTLNNEPALVDAGEFARQRQFVGKIWDATLGELEDS